MSPAGILHIKIAVQMEFFWRIEPKNDEYIYIRPSHGINNRLILKRVRRVCLPWVSRVMHAACYGLISSPWATYTHMQRSVLLSKPSNENPGMIQTKYNQQSRPIVVCLSVQGKCVIAVLDGYHLTYTFYLISSYYTGSRKVTI